jgi:hypothetical protein
MREFTHSFYACEIAEVVYDAREVAALLEAKDKLILMRSRVQLKTLITP